MLRVKGRSTAERIAEAAARLFYRDGIHVVGVDRVADEAGVTKRTLYKHFRTKDELIAAALRQPSPVALNDSSGSPAERILDLFQQVADWVALPDFRGCKFINAAIELANQHHPARIVARDAKERRRKWFYERGREMAVGEPDVFAEQMMVLFDGAIASATVRGAAPAIAAKRAVFQLIHDWTNSGRAAAAQCMSPDVAVPTSLRTADASTLAYTCPDIKSSQLEKSLAQPAERMPTSASFLRKDGIEPASKARECGSL